jgi:hypothetical protein
MKQKLRRIFSKYFPLFLLLWILLVLYPNPLKLIISIQRGISPDTDPAAVESLSRDLPSDPVAIEDAVLQQIPYSHDWEVYSMPWYVPTVKEALEKGKGDCKARALVLASILEAKNIPYRLNWSPNHVWVEYESKEETPLENPDVKFYQQDPETGKRSFQFPRIPFSEVLDSFWQGFWSPMPGVRKALLIPGSIMLIIVRLVWFKKKRVATQDRQKA